MVPALERRMGHDGQIARENTVAETPTAFIKERLFLTADLQIQASLGLSARQSWDTTRRRIAMAWQAARVAPNINKKALGKLICFHQSDTGCATNSGNNCCVVPRCQIDQER